MGQTAKIMTIQEINNKMKLKWIGYGTYRVTINYRNKEYSCTTHNTLATDRIKDRYEIPERKKDNWYTYGEAVRALWEECKQKNGIGIEKY